MYFARLFCGIMYCDLESYDSALKELISLFGVIQREGEAFEFNFTLNYEKEFGAGLKKRFVVFEKIIKREELPDIKLLTCEIEKKLRNGSRRVVNIDPGYITTNSVIVASTKEHPHRIYLGKGIFGDLQLVLRKQEAIDFYYTYPDYRLHKGFFLAQRVNSQKNSKENNS
jgi:hypothetical protein